MARVTTVQKARKDQPNCRACGKEIKAGDPYKWCHPRYKAKVVVCMNCQITVSMTSSSRMVPVWEAQTEIAEASLEDLAGALNAGAEVAREVGEEYQEACDNQREYFPDAERAQENEEKAEGLQEWADALEEAAGEVETLIEEIDELKTEFGDLQTELETNGLEARDIEIRERQEEIEKEITEKTEEAEGKSETASELSVDVQIA